MKRMCFRIPITMILLATSVLTFALKQESLQDLIARADAAMYQEKALKRKAAKEPAKETFASKK